MSQPTQGYAAQSPKTPLAPFKFERRDPGPADVAIDILFCGICHSDVHQARDEWGGSTFPMVPGHEIVGRVSKVGSKVTRFKSGDMVGIGCFVDSCRKCASCKEGLEQYCEGHLVMTYNGTEKDEKTPTQGGYSNHIVADENYLLKIPKGMAPERAAPLLCAGITTYSPMMHWKIGKGHKLGVIGLGGLGHMAVQIGNAMGAEITVFSTSRRKEADAKKMGATHFEVLSEGDTTERLAGKYDFLINTVSANQDMNVLLSLLKRDGTMILVGAPSEPSPISSFSLIMGRRKLGGSLIGGIRETQEMLDFCAKHDIASYVEVIPASKINEAYERMLRSDVKYRFVIDAASF